MPPSDQTGTMDKRLLSTTNILTLGALARIIAKEKQEKDVSFWMGLDDHKTKGVWENSHGQSNFGSLKWLGGIPNTGHCAYAQMKQFKV